MDQPKFLEFSEETLADWRGHPVTAALLEWFAWEGDQASYACAAMLRKGDARKAMSIAGKAEAFEEALRQCFRKEAAKEEVPEPFVHPAFRFNPEDAPKDQLKEEGENAGTE